MNRLIKYTLIASAILVVTSRSVSAGENWPQFRGHDARGVIDSPTNLPTKWSAEENVVWKSELPGRGWSSPIVWQDRIFLTTVINEGETEEAKKGLYFGGNRIKPPESIHQWLVICLSLESGNVLWRQSVHEGKPETSVHIKNSFASETPVTDGEHVFAYFGGLGIYCFDMEGNPVWSRPIEPRKMRYGWGTAASPIMDDQRLYIINDNEEASYVMAIDKRTGKEVWRTDRDEGSNWSTPYLWAHASGTELVTPGTDKIRSYDLAGDLLWSLEGMSSITIATPYSYNDLLIVSSGYVLDRSKPLYAIRPGAQGDITLTEEQDSNDWIAWSQPMAGPYNPSTVAYQGNVYVLYDRGFFAAFDASTGEEVYGKQRIPKGRAFTASPWVYAGKIFCLNEDGVTHVIDAGDTFRVSHTNALADDEMAMATPAIVDDHLLIRTDRFLYCIGHSDSRP